MLTVPRTAEEAYHRLSPDIDELSDCITGSVLAYDERARLARMVATRFAAVAASLARPKPRLVFDRSRQGQG